MSDKSIELPEGWEWTTIGDITVPSDRKIEPLEIQSIPYIGLEHIEKDTGRLLDKGNSSEVKSTKSKFSAGDLLYGKLRPYLNKVHLVNFEGICSTDILVFPKSSYVANEFLAFRFLSSDFVSYASQNVNGVQHPRVNFQTLAEFLIALPPIAEQKRIVAKIEELRSRTQKAREALEAIPEMCDRFCQSVLAAAFRGDLTADWREENFAIEPAKLVMEKIKQVKLKTIKKNQLELMDAQTTSIDWESLPVILDSWTYTFIPFLLSMERVGLKTGPFGSMLKKEDHRSSGVPVLGIENISRSGFIQGSKIYIDQEKASELADYEAKAGDILISRSGTVGEICIVPPELGETRISTNLIRVCLNYKVVLPEYFCFLFRGSTFVLSQILELCSGSTRDFLNQTILNFILFPIPPLEEQKAIVAQIAKLFEIADRIHQQYADAKARLEKLDRSILAQAFRGELVPQDPNDEPASVLLDQIRQEREKQGNTKKTKSNGTKLRNHKAGPQTIAAQQMNVPGLEP